MHKTCDVPGCTNKTYIGWRPLTERMGKQICENHWFRHKAPEDSFDLFDAFGFTRLVRILRLVAKKEVARCSCGAERLRGHKFCKECAIERERQRKKEAYHKRKNQPQQEPAEQAKTWRCRDCGEPREAGHSYCLKCAERRKKLTRRQAQSRYWKQTAKVSGLN